MAVTMPSACHASTMRTLFSGCTRAYTEYFRTSCANSASGIASSSAPVMAICPGSRMPSSLAIAVAVSLWSPVIITGRMPALRHRAMASFTSGRIGSIIPHMPIQVRSCSSVPGSLEAGRSS